MTTCQDCRRATSHWHHSRSPVVAEDDHVGNAPQCILLLLLDLGGNLTEMILEGAPHLRLRRGSLNRGVAVARVDDLYVGVTCIPRCRKDIRAARVNAGPIQ